jgi:hypothetical protein
VIKRIIASVKKEWLVVTSDRDIAGAAWASGSIPVPSDAFLSALGKKGFPCSEFSDEEVSEEEYYEHQRKGNPRHPRKKRRQ